ncbi:uncharacterized protein PF3D7_1120000-like [Periplaneta americana]|uniref:uncharacterized protein PF3D7_1120000-like n=1 Tax=Periplaneta americana TaxID=6978 RepID=UPI0037E735AA
MSLDQRELYEIGDNVNQATTDQVDRIGENVNQATIEQNERLLNLKKEHEELKQDIQEKIRELHNIQEKRALLRDQTLACSIRIQKKEEKFSEEKANVLMLHEEVMEIQKRIEHEKETQLQNLKCYEEKMAVLVKNFKSGPMKYDKNTMKSEITNLRKETRAVTEKVTSVEKQLTKLREIYGSLLEESTLNDESALKSVISEITEEKIASDNENNKLQGELTSLTEVSNRMKEEIDQLKVLHGTVQ